MGGKVWTACGVLEHCPAELPQEFCIRKFAFLDLANCDLKGVFFFFFFFLLKYSFLLVVASLVFFPLVPSEVTFETLFGEKL